MANGFGVGEIEYFNNVQVLALDKNNLQSVGGSTNRPYQFKIILENVAIAKKD